MKSLRIILFALALSLLSVDTGHAQGLSQATVYVQNPTSGMLYFYYRMGGDDWQKQYIRGGHTLTFTGIAPHYIRYGNGHGRTIQYKLTPGSTNYFSWSNRTLYLQHR